MRGRQPERRPLAGSVTTLCRLGRKAAAPVRRIDPRGFPHRLWGCLSTLESNIVQVFTPTEPHMNYREMGRLAAGPDRRGGRRLTFVATVLGGSCPAPSGNSLPSCPASRDLIRSMRQREWLHALRSRATRRSKVKGYQACTLVRSSGSFASI